MLVPSVIRTKLDELVDICLYEQQQATAKAAQVGLSLQQQTYWTQYATACANARQEILGIYDIAP